jgi:hypothetical protein
MFDVTSGQLCQLHCANTRQDMMLHVCAILPNRRALSAVCFDTLDPLLSYVGN